jgi:uncharacterized protein with HEPN domain
MLDDRDYLLHLQRAVREIAEHTAGMSRESYAEDTKTQRAVERNLQIIGQAVHKLSREFKEKNLDIEWEEVYATRNVVVHHYFGVDSAIVWDILQEDSPRLAAVVDRVLYDYGKSEGPAPI